MTFIIRCGPRAYQALLDGVYTVIKIESLYDYKHNPQFLLCIRILYYNICVCVRVENWWHISTQKPPNVGSSSAISEPIIAGLVSARGLPNPMKLGNQLHRPTQTG